MFSITQSKLNKDLPQGLSRQDAANYFRQMLKAMSFESRLKAPVIDQWAGSRWIFRGDASESSLKGYGAEPLIASCKEKTLVYCAPRVGMAMDAIATLAKIYDKKCVFFCPASAEASMHQKALLYYGAELRFVRIAAMPTLNGFAKHWALKHGAKYLPFGLANEPLVTAGIIDLADRLGVIPSQIWMSVSTGTAIRALQIAWSKAEVHGVVVARNMHDGEIGEANLWSSEHPFLKDVKPELRPPFPSTSNYDAKCWQDFENFSAPGAIFMNVGCDDKVRKQAESLGQIKVDSYRDWGDLRDLE